MKKIIICLLSLILLTSCNALKKTKDEATEHEHIWDVSSVTIEPTCTTDGEKVIMCSGCNEIKTEVVEKTGHKYNETWNNDSQNHWHECACHDKKDLGAHDFDEGFIVSSPTSTEDGLAKYTCEECGYVEEKILPSLEEIDLSNISFESLIVNYDSKKHSIYVVNLPEMLTVNYIGNEVSEIGTHTVVAKIYYGNELLKELTATITITKNSNVELPLV